MKNVIAATITIYTPLVVRFAMLDDVLLNKLSIFYIACALVFLTYARSMHDDLIENIRLKLANESTSLKDPLTGLWNRRGLQFFLDKLIPHASRHHQPYGIILLDIDHFKEFNDRHGHSAGDDLLVHVARCLEHEAREDDIVVRYGGEEFLIVLPDIKVDQLQEIAERLFGAIRAAKRITISAGLAVHNQGGDFNALLQQADQALYRAKREGRNVYRFASQTELARRVM
jgi:diguanylate cyclase (GGDEF)-like protein